ncbi:hypothetical protein D3C87_1585140 [compost metagenome]
MQLDVGVDVAQALGHHLDLGAPDAGAEGDQLAVAVGGGDHVHVDQGQGADARAAQGLHARTAHPADARDQDVGGAQPLEPGVTHQDVGALREFLPHDSSFCRW